MPCRGGPQRALHARTQQLLLGRCRLHPGVAVVRHTYGEAFEQLQNYFTQNPTYTNNAYSVNKAFINKGTLMDPYLRDQFRGAGGSVAL